MSISSRKRRSGGALDTFAAMVTALGGNARFSSYDGRTNVTAAASLVQTWDDSRGPAGFGPQLVASAASGNKPLYSAGNGTIETNQAGGNQNWLASAIDAKFDLSTSPRTIIYIGSLQTGQNSVVNLSDAAHTKYGGFYSGFDSSLGTQRIRMEGTTFNVLRPGSVSNNRILAAAGFPGHAATVSGNASVTARIAGSPALCAQQPSGFPYAAGSFQLIVGGTTSAAGTPGYANAVIRAILVIDHQLVGSEWDAVQSWARAEHGITIDLTKSSVVWEGNSITEGVGASVLANCTVSKAMAHFPTVNFANNGVSAQDGAVILLQSPIRSLPSYDSSYPLNVFVIWGEGTNEIPGGLTGAQAYANTQAIALAAKARGYRVVVGTVLPAGTHTGAQNTERLAMNTLIRNNIATIGDVLADPASIATMLNTADASKYTDTVHPTDAGHLLCSDDATFGFAQALAALGL